MTKEYLHMLIYEVARTPEELTGGNQSDLAKHPIYAASWDAAIQLALAWLSDKPQLTYIGVWPCTAGTTLDTTFFPGERDTDADDIILFLYIFEYFIAHQLYQQAIYAKDLDAALAEMNTFYARSGLGNDHKSITRNTQGIHLNGTYYPPEKTTQKT